MCDGETVSMVFFEFCFGCDNSRVKAFSLLFMKFRGWTRECEDVLLDFHLSCQLFISIE